MTETTTPAAAPAAPATLLPRLPEWAFRAALYGWRWDFGHPHDEDALPDGTRPRLVVAAALDARARERRREGRPDVAARLSWLSGRVWGGQPATKRVLDRLRRDLEVLRERCCDGPATAPP